LRIYPKSVGKGQVPLKTDTITRYITLQHMYFYDYISLNSSYSEKYFRQKLYRNLKHKFYAQ